jgi:phosphate transport system permease protein
MILLFQIILFALFLYFLGGAFAKKKQTEIGSLISRNYKITAVIYFFVLAFLGFYLIEHYIKTLSAQNIVGFCYFLAIVLLLKKIVFKVKFNPEKSWFKFTKRFLIFSSIISISVVILIVFSLLSKSTEFFSKVSLLDFLFGKTWNPVEENDATDALSSYFGFLPILGGTLLITFIAVVLASFLGIFGAIYITQYIPQKSRNKIKPILEILAGIPSVVYGFFAVVTVAPFFVMIGENIGIEVQAEAALIAAVIIGFQITPLILSLSDDAIYAVPNALKEASIGLGATKAETIFKVIIPSSLPGIISGVILAFSRAIGETMVVVMAAGRFANLTLNPFEAVTTATVQIVMLLTGDQEFSSVKTLSAFALGISLFVITLILNFIALRFSKKFYVAN